MSNFYQRRFGSGAASPPPPAYTPPPPAYTPPPPPAPTPSTQRPTPSQLASSTCPSCGSGNYMKVGTAASAGGSFDVMRCYDCGYPKEQMGSGVPTSGKEAAHKAVQVQGTGFNPTVIVGRVE